MERPSWVLQRQRTLCFFLIQESRFLSFFMLGHITDNSRITGLFQRTKDHESGLFLSQLHSCLLLGHNTGWTMLCHGTSHRLLLKPSWSPSSPYIILWFSSVWMILAIFSNQQILTKCYYFCGFKDIEHDTTCGIYDINVNIKQSSL